MHLIGWTMLWMLSVGAGSLSTFSFARADQAIQSQEDSGGGEELEHESLRYCYAWTRCWNGRTISCSAYEGHSRAQSCSWWVSPFRAVQCTGFNAWGQWVNIVRTCHY